MRHSQPEYRDYSSNRWHASASGAHAWDESWESHSSEWDRSKWSTPTARNLGGSDHDTDREWHARMMRYGERWAHDPTWSQQKRAKPTHTDPEDDVKVDLMMPIGSTSKTWSPKADGQFWPRRSGSGEDWAHSSPSSSRWKPRLRTEKHFSGAAGDTSEASTASQHLGSIDESEGDAVRDWRARYPRHWNA